MRVEFRKLAIGALAVAMLISVRASAATTRTASATYGDVDGWGVWCSADPEYGNIAPYGCAFNIRPTETSVSVSISDATGLDTSGHIYFLNNWGGQEVGEGSGFCGSISGVEVPAGATLVGVSHFSSPGLVPPLCSYARTQGTVTVEFSS